MKASRFLVFFMAMVASIICHGQNSIDVQRFKQWGHEHLTVTNNWNGLYVTVTDGELPQVLSVITEVNGESTKDMTPSKFQEKIQGNQKVTLDYLHKENGANVKKKCTFEVKKNYFLAGGVETTAPFTKPSNINIASDSEIDFFDYCTFDFKIEGDDPLTDKDILEELALTFEGRGMKRDKSSPDLVFSMTKSLQQTTNSVYVPKTQQVVNTGSTTSVQRNFITGKNYLATQQHNTVVTSGGYTHTNVSATFHLILTILDGAKLRQSPNSLPVVWKLDYNEFSSEAIDLMATVRTNVAYWCLNYPFSQPKFSYSIQTTGVAFRSQEDVRTGEIIDVLPGTDAWNKGFRPGSKIEKAYLGAYYLVFWYAHRKTFFEANSYKEKHKSFNLIGYLVLLPVPIPNSTPNDPYNYLTYKPSALPFSNVNYKVVDEFGSKFKIKGAVKKSDYYYEYIY